MTDATAAHQVEYERAPDGTEIPVRVFGPEGDQVPLVMLHGLRGHSGWFLQSAGFLAALGHPVYSFDRQGAGLSRQRPGRVLRLADMLGEIRTIVDRATRRRRARQVHLLGHCFGAIPGAIFACCHPDRVASLILSTPGIHTRGIVTPLETVQIACLGFVWPRYRLALRLEAEDLADLEPARQFIRNDPLSTHDLGARSYLEIFLARRRLKRSLPRLRAPLFMALAGRDRLSDNVRSTAFFHRAPSANKRLRVYPEATHILEFSREKDAFFRDLADWLHDGYNRDITHNG